MVLHSHLQPRRVVSVEAEDAGALAAAWPSRRRLARTSTAARDRAARALRRSACARARPLCQRSTTGLSLTSLCE